MRKKLYIVRKKRNYVGLPQFKTLKLVNIREKIDSVFFFSL